MKAVVIGAGRIGCGLAADVLHRSGYEVTMIGRGAALAALARTGRCTVRLTDGVIEDDHTVEFAHVVDVADTETAAGCIATADVVCTAVGAGNLISISDLLATGLHRAPRPVDVIAFENKADAAAVLRCAMIDALGDAASRHGYSGAVIARAVAQSILPGSDTDAATDAADDMLVIGDRPDEVFVDGPALVGRFAPIRGLVAVDSFRAYYRRKLYRFSAGHATAAYLGALKGYRYLHAAVADPEIADATLQAMREGQHGLAHRYGKSVAGTEADLTEILGRFGNAALGDTVERVGRDCERKLAHDERLIGAARLAHKSGVIPTHLALAAAAALGRSPDHAHAAHLLSTPELTTTISRVTGLRRTHPITRSIAASLSELAHEGVSDGLLLSLTDRTWAWEAPFTESRSA